MKIIFARHGESQANLLHVISNRSLPHGLSDAGMVQAQNLAHQLQSHRITRIYSSPVRRAVETAAILAQKMQLEVETVDALREYDCGMLEGRSDDQAWREWKRIFDLWYLHQHYEECIEGGETFQDMQERFIPFIQGLLEKHANTQDEILCISHGGVYSLMLPLVVKNVDPALISRFGLGYTSYLITRPQQGRLVCVEWNGQAIGEE